MSNQNYIDTALKQFRYYKLLGERTFDQLKEEECLRSPEEGSNSVAVIVNHISGNMLSRWTNFFEEDGEKPWRNREKEFEDVIRSKSEMVEKWDAGWKVVFDVMEALTSDDLERIIYIRNEGHTVIEAVQRQLCHYSYHIGQITFLGKWIKGPLWQSLSIPKGESKAYNVKKFGESRKRKHFTDDVLRAETGETER